MLANVLLLSLLMVVCIPVTVYLSVKLGTHAWLRARRDFLLETYVKEGKGKNG